MKKRNFLGLLAATVLSVSATGCYFLPDEEKIIDPPSVKTSETNYTTVKASKKDISKRITASGRITSQHQSELFFEGTGTIKAINVRPGDEVKEGDILCELDMGDLEYDIKAKELYIKKAELNIKLLKEQGASQTEIDIQQAEKEILEHEIISLNEQKAAMVIVAPEDATVMSLNYKVGDKIDWQENPVITLFDPDSVYVAVSPDEIKQFEIGTELFIKMEGELYDAVVFMTPDNIPEEDEENSYGIEFEKKKIYVKFKDASPENCINAYVDTILELEKRENVVVVANNVIKTINGEKVVYLLKDGKKVASKVEIGLQSGAQSEILSGVNEGDEIVIR